jgi:hypothetical protein
VPERKQGFLVQIKEGEKDSFPSGTICEIRIPNSNKKGNNKARTINKRLPPPNTIEKLLTKADWTSVYNDLDAEIKITKRGPLTCKSVAEKRRFSLKLSMTISSIFFAEKNSCV